MNSTSQGRILNPRYEFYTPLWIGVVPRGTTPLQRNDINKINLVAVTKRNLLSLHYYTTQIYIKWLIR